MDSDTLYTSNEIRGGITCKITSGFGNQLFQYAFAYALSRKCNCGLHLDALSYSEITDRPFWLNQLKINYSSLRFQPDKNKCQRTICRLPLVVGKKYFFDDTYHRMFCCRYINKRHSFSRIFALLINKTVFTNRRILNVGNAGNINKKKIYLIGFWQSELYFIQYKAAIMKMFRLRRTSQELEKTINYYKNLNSVAVHIRRGDYIAINGCIYTKYYLKAIYRYRGVLCYECMP